MLQQLELPTRCHTPPTPSTIGDITPCSKLGASTDHPNRYAVQALPDLGEAHTSSDDRPRKILRSVKRLLTDWAQTPLLGIDRQTYLAYINDLVEADGTLQAAAANRQRIFSQFVSLVTNNRGRVVGTYLDDLVLEFHNKM